MAPEHEDRTVWGSRILGDVSSASSRVEALATGGILPEGPWSTCLYFEALCKHMSCARAGIALQNTITCSMDPLVMFRLWRVPQLATTPNAHLQECVAPTQSYPHARAPCSLFALPARDQADARQGGVPIEFPRASTLTR